MMRRILKIAAGLVAVLAVAVGILAINAALLPSGITRFEGTGDDVHERLRDINADSVAGRLAEAVSFETVSNDDRSIDPEPFLALHDWLKEAYPSAHAVLDRELVSELSLVYRWPGNSDCPAVGFVTHLDVVPVEGGTEAEWTYPPFQGVVADGFVWGRGALDAKSSLIYVMEAIETLSKQEFVPRCDVYVLAGHDEEIGGADGAGAIASLLRSRNVRFSWLVDEAGGFSGNLDGSIEPMVANIGVAQRGFANVRITASAEGGHSASGIEETAITRLSRAIVAIRENPMPGGLDGITEAELKARATGGLFLQKFMAANMWLARPLAEWTVRSGGHVNYLRSTMAVTVVEGGSLTSCPRRPARSSRSGCTRATLWTMW
ncbi:MAG: M20/M25/M40 family metallo-hydrolase [Woeseiaceae bacterium]